MLPALVLNRKPRGWQFVRTVYMEHISVASAMALIAHHIQPDWGIANGFLKATGLSPLAQNWLFGVNTAFGAVTVIWFIYAGYHHACPGTPAVDTFGSTGSGIYHGAHRSR